MQLMTLPALEKLRDTFARHNVRYLVIGKGAALLHGFPDTTQDADLFVHKTKENAQAITSALRELGFEISDDDANAIQRGKDFVQLRNGPFPLDLIHAPDGIDRFEDAWKRGVDIDGFFVCSLNDIIASKRAANRTKDREVLRRLEGFQEYQRTRGAQHAKRLSNLETTFGPPADPNSPTTRLATQSAKREQTAQNHQTTPTRTKTGPERD